MMKKWLLFLAAVVSVACSSLAQTAPGVPTQGPGNTGGLLYASNFGLWSVPMGNQGQFSWSSPSFCRTAASGIPLVPVFSTNAPIIIKDQTPSLTETVTPTAVQYGGSGCSITVHPANQHSSFTLISGTAGLQEAINYAAGLPYQVVLTPDWSRIGGTTGMITSAKGNTNVTIFDQRVSVPVAYAWNGSAYVTVPIGSGGSVPSGLNGLPTYYQGTPGGGTTTTVGAGPGAISIPNAVNDGSTDATSAINAALALGYPLQLNDNCRGGNSFYALAGQLLISDTSAVSFLGSGGTGATFSTGVHCQTRLVFSGTTASTVGLVVQATSTHNLTNILLKNLNLSASFSSLAAGIGLTVNCAASAPTQKGVCNDFQADNVFITGFPQGTYFTNLGNVHIGTLYTQGTPNSIGWMNQWGGSSTSPGSGSNSVVVDKLWGEDSSSETNTTSSLGFLNITTGTGYKVTVGDLANYTHGIQVGGYTNSGGTDDAWDITKSGGTWPVAATADITLLNQDDTVLGPMVTAGTSSHVEVHDFARPNLQCLCPRFQVASGGFLQIDENGGPGVAAQAFGSITQTAGSSAYTSGVQYWFWAQYENTAAQLGAITVEWHSAVGASVNTTITTNGNTVTLGAFATATANVACVNIYRGTTSAFASSTLISSCATLPYVSNGSESTGAAPTASNVPMVYQTSPNSVTCKVGMPGAAAFAISGTVYQLQDIQGNYANICNGFTETPNQATPAALQAWAGYPQYQPPPTSGTGSDHLWVGRQTITGGTLAFSQFDMFNISLPISTTVNDITTGLFLKGSQQGLGTAAVGAMLQMTCTNTGANVCVPAFFENLSSTAGANVATFTDANGSVTLNNNLMTVQGRPELIEPFTAAISGTNQSSPKLSWAAFGFQTTTSGSTGATIALANVISNTTNTPTSTLTATVTSGANLTPTYAADFSALTAGFKVDHLTDIALISGSAQCVQASTAGLLTGIGAPCITSTGLSGMTAGQVPLAATATTATSSKPIQGTDTNLLSSGMVSGTGSALCLDANGGASTAGCTAALLAPTSLTTSSGTSDPVTVTGMTSSGHCQLTPTNASAATNYTTTYVSAKTTNQITVTHTATASMAFDIACTSN